jgi:competence protein ComEC
MRGNYANYLFNQGIYFTLYIKNDLDIVRLNKNKVWTINKFPVFLKKKIEARIRRNLSGLSAYVVEAMILGEKDNLPASLYNLMVKCGTVHILVVSGFNVGIVAFIVLLFLKVIRLRRKIRIFITIICLVVYCLATGASNPVVRATIMAVVFLLAYLFKRQPDIYISLAIAAIFILGICPRQLFDVGFQLSFASVFFIAYLYPKFSRLLRIDSCRIKFIRFFVDGFLVSFSAWLGTMGIIASNFRSFSPITTLANIFVVPLATLITLSGFSLLFTGWLFPQLATFIARTLELWVWLLLGIHNMLVKLPFSYLSF